MNPGRDDGARGGGLAPRVPQECRDFLAGAMDRAAPTPASEAHATRCASCAARLAFHRRAAAMLAHKPALPAALSSRSLLEAVHERIVRDSEAASRVGPVLADHDAVAAPAGDWRDELLESTAARAMSTPPATPSDAAWVGVRNSLLLRVVRARSQPRWRIVALIGAAAAVTAAGWLAIPKGTPDTISIVFADLETAPSVEYAFVRRGPSR